MVIILAFGFTLASILGYIAHRIKMSPILGYLLAGYIIGPYSPGFVADLSTSEQLAEIGVVLMMFGVGLHLKWQDLISVKNIAIPGAIGQTAVAAIMSAIFARGLGWSWEAGLVVGMSVGVASTVVLIRMLSDQKLLTTPEGHIAVGWLIVEDIFTVIFLLLLPSFALSAISIDQIAGSIAMTLIQFILLMAAVYLIGFKIVSYILAKVVRLHSNELFTLTILAITFLIAITSTLIFGMSIALGAFIAGMTIGQTESRQKALVNALPLKDMFAVIFFLSIGMLFNPTAIFDHIFLFLGLLSIILIVKPLSAIAIVLALRYPLKTALIIAAALAQIGEFSFILSEEAMRLNILPDEGYDMIIACAIVSIALNPLFFKAIPQGIAPKHIVKQSEKGLHSH